MEFYPLYLPVRVIFDGFHSRARRTIVIPLRPPILAPWALLHFMENVVPRFMFAHSGAVLCFSRHRRVRSAVLSFFDVTLSVTLSVTL